MRTAAALGDLQEAPTQFEPSLNVCQAGVLFLLPALLSQGLLQGQTIYQKLKDGYYGLVHILLLMSFMALSRIKNPEQLKLHNPGEFGKILGLDRVPEVKCLRGKLDEISDMKKSKELIDILVTEWINQDGEIGGYFYLDGHVRVYNGYLANRPKCYVSRQKLCMPGFIDWWVNDCEGKPYFFVTGEINEKLIEILKREIIPRLKNDLKAGKPKEYIENSKLEPLFTMIFDREGSSAKLAKELWEEHRIAVIYYRKNVKDKWDEKIFTLTEVEISGKIQTMKIAEKVVEVSEGFKMVEVRKLSESGHQTVINTTNFVISTQDISARMFSRWSQENYFNYMTKEYDIDHLINYSLKEIDTNPKIVNPSYRELTKKITTVRGKLKKKRAELMKLVEESMDKKIDESIKMIELKSQIYSQIEEYKIQEEKLIQDRKQHTTHIRLEQLPENERFTKLDTEKRYFVEAIKMIAYRAETRIVNILSEYYSRNEDEGRSLVKEIIKSDADLFPDYQNNTLTVRLHSMSTPRANKAVRMLCEFLNETETIYPQTSLRIIYESVG